MGRHAYSRCSFEKPRPQMSVIQFSTALTKATIACVIRFGSEVRRAKLKRGKPAHERRRGVGLAGLPILSTGSRFCQKIIIALY